MVPRWTLGVGRWAFFGEKANVQRSTSNVERPTQSERRWLIAALAVAVFYSLLALRLAFRFPNLVQDDARQHVFWMARFRDPTLFPNDLIADYFQAVAPKGYSALYLLFAQLGLEPLWLSKLLPAFLGVATAWIAFLFFTRLLADSRAAFVGTVLLTQLLWLGDDIISATPRAFAVGLLLAFLYFALRRKWIACVVVLAV
ncbi:MAG TPA: hypothetical protein VG095_09105, partial [Chthoniobacterales bacterium]|nr:hypothetical protein [Chthoniobacterales bacterium]